MAASTRILSSGIMHYVVNVEKLINWRKVWFTLALRNREVSFTPGVFMPLFFFFTRMNTYHWWEV